MDESAVTDIEYSSEDTASDAIYFELAHAIVAERRAFLRQVPEGSTVMCVKDTFGPIFGMDMMCNATPVADLRVGSTVMLHPSQGPQVRLTVGALDAQRTESGEIQGLVGIGLKGENASLVQPGDLLVLD